MVTRQKRLVSALLRKSNGNKHSAFLWHYVILFSKLPVRQNWIISILIDHYAFSQKLRKHSCSALCNR